MEKLRKLIYRPMKLEFRLLFVRALNFVPSQKKISVIRDASEQGADDNISIIWGRYVVRTGGEIFKILFGKFEGNRPL
jgi:hypothetical protein